MILLPLLAVVMGAWAFTQIHQGVNTNISWLTTEASRFLSGERMSDGFYTTNPPLSMLLYTPVAFASHHFGVPVYYAIFFYGIFLTMLSVMAVWVLLPRAGIEGATRLVFITSYLISCTLLPGHHFGDREVVLVEGLIPLGLIQIGITRGIKSRWRLIGPVIVLGTLATLLKPQFLIVPVLLTLHRLHIQKNLRGLLTPDCLIIAATVLAYIGFVVVFLPDFLTTVLPDISVFYVSFLRNNTFLPAAFMMGLVPFAMICLTLMLRPQEPGLIVALAVGCLAGIFSYVLQGKFFYYHLLPALMFFQCGMALLINGTARDKTGLAAALVFSLAFGIAGNRDWLSPFIYPSQYAVTGKNVPKIYHWPSHDDYRRSELVKLVRTYAPRGSYFVFGSMPVVNIPAAYTDSILGSRFPCFWFLPQLVDAEEKIKNHQPSNLTADELQTYKKKYAAMVTGDFKRYTPSLVILAHIYMTDSEKNPMDFANYFSFDPDFARLWKKYRKIQTLTINSRDYYGGYDYGSAQDDVIYDVYIRADAPIHH